VRDDVRVLDAGIFRLDMEDPVLVSDVVVEAQERRNWFGHSSGELQPSFQNTQVRAFAKRRTGLAATGLLLAAAVLSLHSLWTPSTRRDAWIADNFNHFSGHIVALWVQQ
jgi:hypothetical protein